VIADVNGDSFISNEDIMGFNLTTYFEEDPFYLRLVQSFLDRNKDDRITEAEVFNLVLRVHTFFTAGQPDCKISFERILTKLTNIGEADIIVFSLRRFLQPVLVTWPRQIFHSLVMAADTNGDDGLDKSELVNFSDYNMLFVWGDMFRNALEMQNTLGHCGDHKNSEVCYKVMDGNQIKRYLQDPDVRKYILRNIL
jgi:hypothetical protein